MAINNPVLKKSLELSQFIGEDQDCSVVALSICLKGDYYRAHNCMLKAGRKVKDGAVWNSVEYGFALAGFDLLHVEKPTDVKTAISFEKNFRPSKVGLFIIRFCDHVACARADSQAAVILDWSATSKKRVERIYRVVAR